MKTNRKLMSGIFGGLLGLSGPIIGGLIYSLFFGDYVNSLTMIPFITIVMSVTLILLIIPGKFIKLK